MKKKIIAALMLCMAFCPSAYARGYGKPHIPAPHSHHSAHVAEYGKTHHQKPQPHHSHQRVKDSDVAVGAVALAIVGAAGIISLAASE